MSALVAVAPSDFDADAPIVALFLHGYGSHERDLVGLASVLPPGVPWVSLRAPVDLGNGGATWYPVVTVGRPDPVAAAEATATVWEWVDEHLSPTTRILPIGFSQGGLMASQLLRTNPDRVAATVILSGFVLDAELPTDALLADSRPPVFWGRGDLDRNFTAATIGPAAAWLRSHTDLEEHLYPGLGHSIRDDELADLRSFLARQV